MSKNTVLSIVEVLLALMAYFISGGLSSIIIKALSPEIGSTPFWVIFHRSIYIPLMLLALYLIRRVFGRWSLKDLGLSRGEGFKASLRDGLIAFFASSLVFLPFLVALLPYYAGQFSAFGETMRQMSIPTLILMFLAFSPIVLIDSPIPEELFYRGYYQGMLCERFKHGVGVLASTLLFGLQHALAHPDWHLGMVAATIPLGFILAFTYHKTKSLISVITPHFLINFLLAYPMVFYAAGHTSIVISACLAIAFASVIVLMLYRYRARDLFLDGLKSLKHLDHRSLMLVSLFTALPLAFSYLAIMFRSYLG